ncbi:MAG: SRPBCC domain-containing protein [Crocinitomicaceae bacterium]|nr:SRPBCC domain-containing protein [Crocinitomicaceae bacterium]
MAFEIRTELEIQGTSQQVWEVLTDFASYGEWNSIITEIKGDPSVGKKIFANIDGMKFKPQVLVFEKEREFRWIGKLLLKGLFDGEHRFQILPSSNGAVKFVQSEKFYGLLVPLFKKKLKSDVVLGFQKMNQELKNRVEKC